MNNKQISFDCAAWHSKVQPTLGKIPKSQLGMSSPSQAHLPIVLRHTMIDDLQKLKRNNLMD